uniref:Uncharacterized protein n=1 Tax=Aquisalinus luteolus TaxID=1566827 RepID=A0A8J3A267_9PROT|nr:hypothetical protein GCM10011355_08730 [Aquisalinus luteolus]
MEKANRKTAIASTTGNHPLTDSNARDVIAISLSPDCQAPETTIASAVALQTTTVSIKGSSRPSRPSEAGSRVLATECAIAADPIPASLE